MRSALIALACLTSACTADVGTYAKQKPRPAVIEEQVFVDDVFTPHEQLLIQMALDGWNEAIGTSVHFSVAGHFSHNLSAATVATKAKLLHTIVVTKEDPTDDDLDALRGGGPVPVAHVDNIPGRTVFVIDYGRETPSLVAVLMHELGHIEGLVHVPVEESLMYPVSNGLGCVDVTTLLELAVLRPELDREGWQITCPAPVRP